ncbi:MAG: hypothetical protein PF588_02410 [Candidatus Kapabacteria bacterium]|jgi:hypothetical protein|nr:hypothetical protein [Candidatus Kapabacteria bacterium]
MKTFILSVFALFLLLSVNVLCDVDNDSWLKTNFPDKEVIQIFGKEASEQTALSLDNEIYIKKSIGSNKYEWLKKELFSENEIINALSYNYIGTDKGLFLIYQAGYSIERVDVVGDMNILDIFESKGGYGTTFLQSPEGLFTFTASELIECALPGTDQEITAMAFSNNRTMSLTTSGELFVSNDNCQTWTKAIENPEGHLFTAIKWDNNNNHFIVGSDKGLFYLTDKLQEVQDYDGGRVNCIIVLEYIFVCENQSKKNKPLFTPFPLEDVAAIGTEENGVYSITNQNEIKQKNDSLGDLNITAFSYDIMGGYLYAGTKEHGIYRTQKVYAGSVEELDLAPYALKIFPNPAKSHASISFHNPEYAEISIAVYDLF